MFIKFALFNILDICTIMNYDDAHYRPFGCPPPQGVFAKLGPNVYAYQACAYCKQDGHSSSNCDIKRNDDIRRRFFQNNNYHQNNNQNNRSNQFCQRCQKRGHNVTHCRYIWCNRTRSWILP